MNLDTIRRLREQMAFREAAQPSQQMGGLRGTSEMRFRQQEAEAARQAFLHRKHIDISQTHGSALEELEIEYKKHGIRIITEG